MVRRLYKHRSEHHDHRLGSAVRAAARGGHLETVQWLLAQTDDAKLNPQVLCHDAVRGGNLDLVKYLCHEDHALKSELQWTITCGSYDIAQWIINLNPSTLVQNATLSASLLSMAARSGNLELVKLCVEKLDTSLLTTRQRESCSKTIAQNAAAGGNVHVLEYLHTSRQERMFFAVDYSSISLEWMFEQDPSDEALLWVIRHSSEEQQAEELRFLKFCMLLNQPPATSAPSWFFVQQLMLLRPTFCRAFDQLPRWAIQRGTMSDLQTLEAIQLPALFIKSALSCLLKHSRDDALLSWFITRCDSTLLDVRVVSWAAKYDAVELLPTMVDKLTSQGEELLRIFGTVVWSAVKHEHVRVLDWVNHKTE